MKMHYGLSETRGSKLRDCCLVGYDLVSQRPAYSLKIPKSKSHLLRDVVRFEADDPEGYDPYKLEYSDVLKLLDSLRQHSRPPKEFEYFVEPWVPREPEHTNR
jgi:hypothetical protein